MKKNSDGKLSKGKMTVMLLQLEGSDDTLQQGFKAIETALEKLSPKVITIGSNSNSNALVDKRLGQEIDDSTIDLEALEDENSDSIEEKKPQNYKKRSYPTPNIIEVDFNSGATNFKDYFNQLGSPESDRQKYLVTASWFKNFQDTEEVSVDHIYTAYKYMNWPVQRDVGQPLRKAKNERLFNSGSSSGLFAINHIGEETLRRISEKK